MNEGKSYLSIVHKVEDWFIEYGDNPRGLGYPKALGFETRYKIMLDVIREKPDEAVTLLDFGCGLSFLKDYIDQNSFKNIKYSGLDISEKFIEYSNKKFPNINYYLLDILDNPDGIPNFDYIIMQGIFTMKLNLSFDEMFNYFQKVISIIFSKSNKGVAFNFMSKAVDWERDDLFHMPTDLLIDYLSKNLSRHFVMRHDYGLYEYTVYLYKNPVN